jgi:hypothetical protein
MTKKRLKKGVISSNNKKQRYSEPRQDLFDSDEDENEEDDNDIILPTLPTVPHIEETPPVRTSSSSSHRLISSSSVLNRTSSTSSTSSVASSSVSSSARKSSSSTPVAKKQNQYQSPTSGNTPLKNQLQNFDNFLNISNRKQYGDPHVIYKSNLKTDCIVNGEIGEYISYSLPNCLPYHSKLEYPKGLIKCEDSVNYNIDPIVSVIVAMQLHVCVRDCFEAENVYNRVLNWLTTPGFFKSVNSEWEDKAFMSTELSKAIDSDNIFRKVLTRITENWKQKLRNKSGPVVRSLIELKPEYQFPDQETGIILRKVYIYI